MNKIIFGTIKGNKYALTINLKQRAPMNNSGSFGTRKHYEAEMTVADKDGDIIESFTREFSDEFGNWSENGMKRAMLAEVDIFT